MKSYHGFLVNVSQKDKSLIDKFKVLGKKWAWGWILYKIEIKPKEFNNVIKQIQGNMKENFYFHLYKNNRLVIVFKNKIFKVNTDTSTWKEAIEYGRSLNIPKKQLDFFPCKLEDETY